MKIPELWVAGFAGLALIAWPVAAVAQRGEILSLEDALQRSGVVGGEAEAAGNPRVFGPREDVAAAEALVEQAGLRPNPELSLEVENFAGSGAFSGLDTSETTFTVGLPIELGGKRKARIEAAEAEVGVARLRSQLSLADLGLLVRQRYIAAVAAQAKVVLLEDILERERELARIAGALVESGREPPLREMRARALLAETTAELKAAQAEALATRLGLGALWGTDVAPDVPSLFPEIDPPDNVLVRNEGLEIRLASAERDAAVAAVERERSMRLPDPTISAGAKRFEGSNEHALVVGVSLPLPLWNSNQGNIAAAEARLRAADARETVAQLDYRQAIAQARANYLAAEAKAETLGRESLPQAEEALRLAEIGYRNGRFPLIEVLAAADARDGIRRALIDSRENQARAAALLIRLAAQ